MKLDVLKQYQLCYIASPYSHYKAGLDAAYADVGAATWKLHAAGIKAYSPIVYCHPIARAMGVDPLDADFWMALAKPVLERCDALVIIRLEGWDKSYGMSIENDRFRAAGKDVWHIDPERMALV